MTKVVFYGDSVISGFLIRGHSTMDYNDEIGKLVCSAVSSSAYMAANTITDIIKADAEVSVDEACMVLKLKGSDSMAETVLRGLKLHLEQLAEQYEKNIMISSEV